MKRLLFNLLPLMMIIAVGERMSAPRKVPYSPSKVLSMMDSGILNYRFNLIEQSDRLAEIEKAVFEFSMDRTQDVEFSQTFMQSVMRVAVESRFDPFFILGIIRVENDMLDANIVNWYGAVGLAQVVERLHAGTYPECGPDLTDVYTNLCYGMNILQANLEACRDNMRCALWNYNGCTVEMRENEENCLHYPTRVQTYYQQMSEAE